MGEKGQKKEVKDKEKKESLKYYGTGRRKSSVARVWLIPGSGTILINDKPMKDYVKRESLETIIVDPLKVTSTNSEYDVVAYVNGGGTAGQAGAVRHGLARALLQVNPEFRKILKVSGLITRDPREKEAKKYGRKKARKGYQYRKR